ncbi:UDP-2,3-diacylglucosamine diphosphatase [Idiomarina xiamenensis]|uniref:Calcineurin-like phosphoesterase domain-containing protein n=1 Tax=Idiomarina xiamenensis 10-D-4 TaxID=740709 RepID=K2LAM6_9GAMM|nr:UDP-2,3-diacylglucosamine diphosphatase [Idiomarina xiamenensis]EKE86880.1 hypothetical protein A10D4_01522 [Idiomarina xiamenensis 10-D-4]
MTLSARAVFISDVHLGTKDCQAKRLLSFLRHLDCQRLYLVGDIVDLWSMKKRGIRFGKHQLDVVRQLLKLARKGTELVYITGNHDEDLRHVLKDYPFHDGINNIQLCNHYRHHTHDGRQLLVIHGDQFDLHSGCHRLLAFVGDKLYDVILNLNRYYNRWREARGYGYWSLSQYLKQRTQKARQYIQRFEESAAAYAKRKGYDGVICGHIHHANIRDIDGISYYNDGDWVESCSAIIEDHNGTLRLLDVNQWLHQQQQVPLANIA